MRSLDVRDGVAGKVCSRCGHWKPLADFARKLRFFHSACKACTRAAYRAASKKDKRAYYKTYNDANRAGRKAYRDANKDRFREYHKERARLSASRSRDYERHRESNRRWAERNKEQRKEAYRRWRLNNPEKALQNDHRRRARLRGAKGTFTLEEWQGLKRAYGHSCLACGRQEPEIKLVADHVIPLAQGGPNDIDNIQPLCEICNKQKNIKTTDYRDGRDWRVELG